MLIDTQKVSPFYVLHRGFRLTIDCRNCHIELSHYKAFEKNASGILSRCDSCGKEIVRMKSRINNESPLNRHAAIDDEVLGWIREGSGLVK